MVFSKTVTLVEISLSLYLQLALVKISMEIRVATLEIIRFSPLRQKLQFENGRKCWNWLFSKIETATRTLFVNHYLFTCGALPIYGEIKIDFFTLLHNGLKFFLLILISIYPQYLWRIHTRIVKKWKINLVKNLSEW